MLVQLLELKTEGEFAVAEYVAGCSILHPEGWKSLTIKVGMHMEDLARMHKEHGVRYVRDYFHKLAEEHADAVMAGEGYVEGERYYEQVNDKWEKITH